MVASSKLEKRQLNEIDRIMLSSMKRSGRQCCWWARLTTARKISHQLVDDSRHKFVMFKWLWGLFWCWHVHIFGIFLVDNVCIHHDCIQKVHKHSYPPPPRLTVDCIMVMPINSTHILVVVNCTGWQGKIAFSPLLSFREIVQLP